MWVFAASVGLGCVLGSQAVLASQDALEAEKSSKSNVQQKAEPSDSDQAKAEDKQPESKAETEEKPANKKQAKPKDEKPKQIIGATSSLIETKSGISFPARIDTGATSCSIHVEKWEIKNESKNRRKNIGKPIRFLLNNLNGEKGWVEGKVISTVLVKTSDNTERRYKVPMTLKRGKFKKKIRVSLNDRSHMEYPLLIGRNFLEGDWLVDVSLNQNGENTKVSVEKGEEKEKSKEAEEEIDQDAESSKGSEKEEGMETESSEESSGKPKEAE